MITKASAAGTRRFAAKWAKQYTADFYRETRSELCVSSIALGTYLGESDDATDALYMAAARMALTGGLNTVDTAINYRCQRSERVIGSVIRDLIASGAIQRDEIVLCSKGGYVPLDGAPPPSRADYEAYLDREYFAPGILKPGDLVSGGHSIAPAFLLDQLRRSLENLGVSGIDYYYLHNPEQQFAAVTAADFRSRLRAAFQTLEECVSREEIGSYGCATWSGLRLPAGSQGHLSLYDMAAVAKEVAGETNHFRVVQLPINLTMSEAVRVSTQRDAKGRLVNVIDAAADLGIDLVVSAPLLQGKLTSDLPKEIRELFAGSTDAQRALAFVRTLPGVITAAVGMKSFEHVEENLAVGRAPDGD